MIDRLTFLGCSLLAVVLITTSCTSVGNSPTANATTMEQWDHVVLASEFRDHPEEDCLLYRYEDPRFNTEDYFDMWEISEETGLSHWDSYYAEDIGTFLSQPRYFDGYVEWNAHPVAAEFVPGRTLRFYRFRN